MHTRTCSLFCLNLKKGRGRNFKSLFIFSRVLATWRKNTSTSAATYHSPGRLPIPICMTSRSAVAPLDRILSETDSPFAAPVPFRGKRNEPTYVEHVVAKIAAVKNFSVEEVAAQIVKNAQQIFKIYFIAQSQKLVIRCGHGRNVADYRRGRRLIPSECPQGQPTPLRDRFSRRAYARGGQVSETMADLRGKLQRQEVRS
jgi:hypothetical protein